jgi:manganese transport protein
MHGPLIEPAQAVVSQPMFESVRASGAAPQASRAGGIPFFLRRLGAFAGPGFMVAVGYMDPGNWATDLAAGSAFGYPLLFIVLLSSLAAIVLQVLAAKLGIATGRDLAQCCRDSFSRPVSMGLWVLAEIGICACDLAELIGTALALKLLFGLPLMAGLVLTIADVIFVLLLARRGFRRLEAVMTGLVALVAGCFLTQLVMLNPDLGQIAQGYLPSGEIVTDPRMMYLAIGIVGATVMPHNLYLHSSIVQSRQYRRDQRGRREAVLLNSVDCVAALLFATLVNSAILILAASAFHGRGNFEVADITEAHRLLTPLLGSAAATLFAVALLAAGQSSSLTATLAGQIVMEGFVSIRLNAWQRRLITRLTAAGPAILVVWLFGEASVGKLLIFSQVLLSLQLPFAVIPLLMFTSDPAQMGDLVNSKRMSVLAAAISASIVVGNLVVLTQL